MPATPELEAVDRRRESPAWLEFSLLSAVAVLFAVALNLTPIHSSDFWIQLKVGDVVRETGRLPRTLLFPGTEAASFAFFAHEWLPSLVSSWLYAFGGYSGMVIYKCALALVVLALAFGLAWRVSRNVALAVAIASLMMLTLNFRTLMRPEIYAWSFALLSLGLLHDFVERGRLRSLLALAPHSLLWANFHASFLFNIAFPLIFALGTAVDDLRGSALGTRAGLEERIRSRYAPLVMASVGILLVSLVNPFGLQLLLHFVEASQSEVIRAEIAEFRPPYTEPFFGSPPFVVWIVLAVLTLVSFAMARARTSTTCILLCGVFGLLALQSLRHIAWFAVVAAYILAVNLRGWAWEGRARERLAAATLAVLAIGIVATLGLGNVVGHKVSLQPGGPLSERALAYLERSDIRGNVFNAYQLGDQLVYHFYPRIRVTIDSRMDAYGEDYYTRYRTMSGRSFKRLGEASALVDFLETHAMQTIITTPWDYKNWHDKGHAMALRESGFGLAFRDESVVVLRRRDRARAGAR